MTGTGGLAELVRDAVVDRVGSRGSTSVADVVVLKTAARAAGEVPHVIGLARRVAGVDVGDELVRADGWVDGSVASVRLEFAVAYPMSVRAVTGQVRRHVAERVESLCGVRVDHLDITVTGLRRDAGGRRVR